MIPRTTIEQQSHGDTAPCKQSCVLMCCVCVQERCHYRGCWVCSACIQPPHTHTHTLGWASHIVLPGVYNLVNSGLEIAAKYLQPGDKLSSLLVPAGPHIQKQHIKLIFMMHVLPLVITRWFGYTSLVFTVSYYIKDFSGQAAAAEAAATSWVYKCKH